MLISLLAAAGALALLTLAPGPDVAMVTRAVVTGGRRTAFAASLGIVTGCLTWGALTVVGLAGLLAASDRAYQVVKLAGAAYLIALGLQAFWHAYRGHPADVPTDVVVTQPTGRAAHPFPTAYVGNLLNPKIGVFYTSPLPQLVPPGAPATATLIGLILLHAVFGIAWLNSYAALLGSAGRLLAKRWFRAMLDSLTGVALIGFGVRVATERG
ncbi:LysE family translocator [Spongisporangium articulatum]|uniref:LysE family translocator n=1 Tax=Spongisporangium articulatum TaxID=3362603 RepID=A0ABW8AQW1_9ACTN